MSSFEIGLVEGQHQKCWRKRHLVDCSRRHQSSRLADAAVALEGHNDRPPWSKSKGLGAFCQSWWFMRQQSEIDLLQLGLESALFIEPAHNGRPEQDGLLASTDAPPTIDLEGDR
jgi:hypothetical protein